MKKLLLMIAAMMIIALPAMADVTLPGETVQIEAGAFSGCKTFVGTLVIPDGVEEIGEEAFLGCTGLEKLVLPASVKTIGARAFQGCTALKGVVLAEGIALGEDAFAQTQVVLALPNPEADFAYTKNGDGTVTIDDFVGDWESPVIVIPDTLGGGTVTALGAAAFKDLLVEQLFLPDGLLTIGEESIACCPRLAVVHGGEKVTHYGANAFFNDTALTGLSINQDAAYFGDYAFQYTLLQDTLYLSSECVFDCFSFHGADIVALGFQVNGSTAALKQRYSGNGPRELVEIPAAYKGLPVTQIICADVGNYINGLCRNLIIPETVTHIGQDAMWGAHQDLVNVTFRQPSRLLEIGTRAFCGLYELESIDLPQGLKIIGDDAFKYDQSLKNLALPDGLESLGKTAFWFARIEHVDIPSAWTEIPDYGFYGMGLTEIVIPARITRLGTGALAGNEYLTSLVIPDTVKEVGAYTFSGCTNLTEAVLPSHITCVPTMAFQGCTSLTHVELPDSVESIEMAAFQGCTNLEYVELPPKVTYVLGCVFENSGVRTKAVERVVAQVIQPGMTDFEKALALHDWLTANADYSSHCTFFGPEGVLVYGEGVCQSYADAFGQLLDKVGIANKPVVSAAMNHAWNLVQLDGEWYHIDVTWDDPVDGEERHSYFGLSDALMSQDHSWDDPESLPAANGTRYQYGVDNKE